MEWLPCLSYLYLFFKKRDPICLWGRTNPGYHSHSSLLWENEEENPTDLTICERKNYFALSNKKDLKLDLKLDLKKLGK